MPADLKAKILELEAIKNSSSTTKFDEIKAKQDEIGDLALSKNTFVNDLARFLKMKPSAKLLPSDYTYAEQLLLQAKSRADAKAAAAAAAAGLLTPKKKTKMNF